MDHLCYICLVVVMLSRLFIAALGSPEGKGLTSWLLFVMFIVFLLLSHLVSFGQVWYLIVSIPDPCCLSYFEITQVFKIVHNVDDIDMNTFLPSLKIVSLKLDKPRATKSIKLHSYEKNPSLE